MLIENRLIAYTLLALLVALVVSFLMTPIVKTFAYKVGAIDVPAPADVRAKSIPLKSSLCCSSLTVSSSPRNL